MSVFAIALLTVLSHEGGLVNDRDDRGGITNYGVSLRYLQDTSLLHPNNFAHFDFNNDGKIDGKDIRLMSKDQASHLYEEYWWKKYGYGKIKSQIIATKMLDIAINMGHRQATIAIQRAIRATSGTKIEEDGLLGPETIDAINKCDDKILLAAFRSEAASIYRSIATPKYLAGWLNRAYA